MSDDRQSKKTESAKSQPSRPPVTRTARTTRFSGSLRGFITGLIGALILIWLGVGGTLFYQYLASNHATVTEHQALDNDGNALTTSSETTISAVASKVSPSVVSILTQTTSPMSYYQRAVQEAAGSGIIVSDDGIVLTNKHVVKDVDHVQVILSDGTTYDKVKVLGTDPLNDLAFLKIDNAKGLKAAELGDSSTIKIGQSVIAIGNSLGEYQNTVTSGIISGLNRPLTATSENGQNPENLNGLIQTDAAINPGNSGGPLLNTSGQVIGVNTAIAANAEGIGFSIPINSAKGILKEVLAGKPVRRAYLGIRYIPVNAAVAKEHKLSVTRGALISGGNDTQPGLVSGSPADKAGLKDGDVITAVNGVKVGSHGSVSDLVTEYAPGDTIELEIVRGKATRTTKVTLGTYS